MSSKTYFFSAPDGIVALLTEASTTLDIARLAWLFGGEAVLEEEISGQFIGPRRTVVSPWSSNVSSILSAAGFKDIKRCELFRSEDGHFDPMLEERYLRIEQTTLELRGAKEQPFFVEDIEHFNATYGLALSPEEVQFLRESEFALGRKLTDSEVYAFGQINSEHCRHKIFNAEFTIDGERKEKTLFELIKETTKRAGTHVVSAYKDNVAWIDGATVEEFSPDQDRVYREKVRTHVYSLKAETHNFPTTVEPFYGASTGSGGEIRDRMAGGKGGLASSGIAVYMTSSPRLEETTSLQSSVAARPWAYQSPQQILTKASNGASDFGNKFGQPLTCGSLLTAELETAGGLYGYDRCIMLAGGVGSTPVDQAKKSSADIGDAVVVLGGENFRIGMAGGSVSSVNSGKVDRKIELSAVQRANPEMQKRVYNVIRALVEMSSNPIKLIHDHGAGGHINCLSELLEERGGVITIDALPIGDVTLSLREILCNESQERMGLVIAPTDIELLATLCERERAPMYVVGTITGNHRIRFESKNNEAAFDLPTEVLFGSSPTLKLSGESCSLVSEQDPVVLDSAEKFEQALRSVLSLEGVGSKDWLTNKVDRCVTGKVAQQQCVGVHQLPLANNSVTALDYTSYNGIVTALGSAPLAALISSAAGSRLAVTEALLNLSFCVLNGGLERVALSANWMWPAQQQGENARLYEAVQALSTFCIELGIPVPTGKDSLSMTMHYQDGSSVRAPGTVIVTAVAPTSDFRRSVLPIFSAESDSCILHIDFSGQDGTPLGGSALYQVYGKIGRVTPDVADSGRLRKGIAAIQDLIVRGVVLAGHDVSYGGLITTLLEMSFASDVGLTIICPRAESLFSEKPGVVLQIQKNALDTAMHLFEQAGAPVTICAEIRSDEQIVCNIDAQWLLSKSLHELRRVWHSPAAALEKFQNDLALERAQSFATQPINFKFPATFTGRAARHDVVLRGDAPREAVAAVVREQGTNGERELSFALHAAGFVVRDVTMTDLISGKEDLQGVSFLGFPGGFSFSDCLGAGKGWAASFLCNPQAKQALESFFKRSDTLSIGICNGCQVMAALGLLYPEHNFSMHRNKSKKFESNFLTVEVGNTKSVMLQPLIGSKLGIWVAHGEGQFVFPQVLSQYDIPVRYSGSAYPFNPNGSPDNAAAVCSKDGRHLAIMPHLERSSLPWQWGHYPAEHRFDHEISPWMLAFVAARKWIEKQ